MYGLDLKLIITNAIGFFLLLFILRKLAWKQLLGAIDQRRDSIRAEVEAGQKLKADAESLRRDYEERMKGIEAEARAKLAAAVHDAERVAAEMKEQAHMEARDMIAKAEERILHEQAKAMLALREDVVNLTMIATEKILKESLDTEKQRKMIRDFLAEIEGVRA